ncbi:HK97 family phage prohead protease [Rhizobiales bacterium TNE-4]|nr:HK97 family phage prohead protease [Rhizobiales bacterium TNE-4]MBV1826567.1 HK97 family phage prohead protease [Rhizobiales bacterium TNE-4]
MTTIEGYASLFDRVDLGRDVVLPGAFTASLERRGPRDVRMLWQHDAAEPVGLWTDMQEDRNGLRVRGVLLPEVKRARELAALIAHGAIDGLSIGFRAIRARRDPTQRLRRIAEIDLWEISLVTFPLLPGARLNRFNA